MSRAAETGRKRLRGSHLGRLRPGAGVIRRAASFRVKVMGIVLLITLTVGGAAIGQTRRDLYQTLTGELENRGRSLALDLSTLGADSLLTRDLFALNVLLAETLEHNPDVVYAFYVDDRGMVAADTFPTGVPTDILAAEPAEVPRTGQTSILLVQTEEGLLRDVRAPILGGKAGVVRLGMTESRVESLIAAATRRLLYVTLLAAGVAVSAGLVLSYVLVSPLRALVEAMRAVGQGDLARRVAPRSEDEVGFLAESFNAMVEELGIQTERSRVIQEAVERNNRELRILQQLSSEEAGIMPPDAYVERAAGLVVEQLAGSTARICLWQGLNDDARLCTAEPGGPPVWLARHELSAGSDAGCPVAGALSGGDCTAECDHVCAGAGGDGGCRVTAPIVLADTPGGLLSVGCKEGGLEPRDGSVVASVARQIGLVLENLRLRDEREAREARLARVLSYTMQAQEGERARIARELHDDAGQRLTYLKLGLKALESEFEPGHQGLVLLENLRDAVGQSIEGIRDMAVQLRPPALDDLGLVPSLERLLRQCATSFGWQVDFQLVGEDDPRLSPECEVAAYRIVQEALTNAGRHAGARRVSLIAEQLSQALVLVVEDDGTGFDVSEIMDDADPARHLGLDGMRERIELVGGSLMIESSPGSGTSVRVRVPRRSRVVE